MLSIWILRSYEIPTVYSYAIRRPRLETRCIGIYNNISLNTYYIILKILQLQYILIVTNVRSSDSTINYMVIFHEV